MIVNSDKVRQVQILSVVFLGITLGHTLTIWFARSEGFDYSIYIPLYIFYLPISFHLVIGQFRMSRNGCESLEDLESIRFWKTTERVVCTKHNRSVIYSPDDGKVYQKVLDKIIAEFNKELVNFAYEQYYPIPVGHV